MRTDITVEELLAQEDWHEERKVLREVLLDCGLEETVKWGQLCYMAHGGNIGLVFALNDTVGFGFMKGALLDDPDGELVFPGPNSKAAMRMDFTSMADLQEREGRLRRFVAQAIANEKKGLKVERDESQMPGWPEELVSAFEGNADFRHAFENLTPGRQRGYLIHFTGAKSSEARARRVAKYRDHILAAKGMHDR